MGNPNRTRNRRRGSLQRQLNEAQAVGQAIGSTVRTIVALRRRLRWARLAWALVAVETVLLVPSAVAFASLCHATGGPLEAVRIVHWFVVESLTDFLQR
jgi:hypothetical protein